MKPIAFVIPWYSETIPGGAEMELRELSQELTKAGTKVEILTTCVKEFSSDWSENYYKPGVEEILGVPVRRFKADSRNAEAFHQVNYKFMNHMPVSLQEEELFMREMVNSQAMYQYMEEHQEEYALFVFIPYMFGTTYYGMQICPEKTILIPCFHDEPYAHMKLFQKVCPTVRGMIFNAKPEEDLAKRLYGMEEAYLETFGVGMHTDIWGEEEKFRAKYHITEPYILYAGRKDSGKNVDTLITYFREYRLRNEGALKLVLLGGGTIDIPNDCKEDIIDLGFVPVEDKYNACAGSLLLCQPSKNESFSLVIMESWLCKRPVLVHEHCEVTKHFAITSKGGLYFKNYFEFEGCVNYIRSHPQLAKQMGESGCAFVKSNFDWSVVVRKYQEYFRKVTNYEENSNN